jgi:hypothetical protein
MGSVGFLERIVLLAVSASLVAACGSSSAGGTGGPPSSPQGGTYASPAPSQSELPSNGSAAPSAAVTPGSTGASDFAFAAADIVAFYQSRGYDCAAAQPSAKAAGYSYRACQQVDSNGRTLVVGVVTDPEGVLADAYASVQGKPGETFLEPVDALGSLAGFLGATLGEDRATSALTWLAGHLGDEYSETQVGSITLATYTPTADDHSRLFVELANPAYLKASPPNS